MRVPEVPEPEIHPTALIAPGAHVYGDVTIAESVFVLFGAIIRAEYDRVTIGAGTNVQDNVVVHCDEGIPCLLGQRVTVGHDAVVHGAEVGDHALIGIGARALNRTVIGEGAWLAAGSVLPEGKTVPAWTLALGVPAKPVRDLSEDEITSAADGVDRYIALLASYREILG